MTPAASHSGQISPGHPAARLGWVDVARGIGILLVVYGHGLRAIYPAAMPAEALVQDRLIYAFHMPLFFVLSGLFLWRSLAHDRAGFLGGRLKTIVWPYLLWSVVSGLIELVAARWVNTPLRLADVLLIPVQPIEQYWFLYTLFLCQLIALALFPSRLVFAGAALAGWLVAPFIDAGMVTRALASLPFVAAGVWGAEPLGRLAGGPLRGAALVLLAAAAVFALLAPVIVAGLPNRWVALAAALVGSLMVIALAMVAAGIGRGGGLALLGEASLAIYVLHTIFSAGARIGLKCVGLPVAGLPMLALTTLAGIVFPYLVWLWAERRGWSVLLGLGAARSRPRAVAATPSLETE